MIIWAVKNCVKILEACSNTREVYSTHLAWSIANVQGKNDSHNMNANSRKSNIEKLYIKEAHFLLAKMTQVKAFVALETEKLFGWIAKNVYEKCR